MVFGLKRFVTLAITDYAFVLVIYGRDRVKKMRRIWVIRVERIFNANRLN